MDFWVFFNTSIVFESVLYYYIVCFYCKFRLKSINNSIEMLYKEDFLQLTNIDIILTQHNQIINSIYNYNKFWKKYYFAILYTIIPVNLMYFHQYFFEILYTGTRLGIVRVSIGSIVCFFGLNLMTASVNKESLVTYKKFNTLYLKKNSTFNIITKRKVLFIN